MTYRSSGELKDIAVDPDEVLAAEKRSRKKRLVGLGIALVLVGGVATGATMVARSSTRAENERAWNAFATCLVGGPLAPGDKASARVRNTQLTAMSASLEARAAMHGDGWPMRCAKPGHALSETLRASGTADGLADAAEKLAKAIGVDQGLSADLSALVEPVFAEAEAAGLSTTRAADVPEPPAPAAPMTLASLPEASRVLGKAGNALNLASMYTAPYEDTTLRLLLDAKDLSTGPVLCALGAGETSLACKKVPKPAAELSPGLRLWGATDEGASPYVFAGDRGKAGIFRSDTGARVIDSLAYGAYGATALRDGSLAYLVWNEDHEQTDLVVLTKDGSRKVSKVVARKDSGNPYYSTAILWNFVAYKTVKPGEDGIRLVVRPIDDGHGLGDPVDVGRIDQVGQIEGGTDEDPHLTGCRTKDATVVRAKGWRNTYLSFFVGGHWTPPVESKGLGGQLQCRAGEATVTHVWSGASESRFKSRIVQSRCTVSDCEEREVEIGKVVGGVADLLPRSDGDLRAIDLGGKLLVVWAAGDRGGLRMRLAPFHEISSAHDAVIFDGHLRDGTYRAESTLVEFQLVPAPGGALLLLGTVDGMYAELIDDEGALHPVATKL